MSSLRQVVERIYGELSAERGTGRLSTAIPQLSQVDRRKFGISVVTLDGESIGIGDHQEPFSIQSISKVFTLALVLARGVETVWDRVGREPSGSAFNSIVQLEYERGRPRNPFINAGALAVTDLIIGGRPPDNAIAEIVGFVADLAGDRRIRVDEAVALAEGRTGFRNAAIANFMRDCGNLDHAVDDVLRVYFRQCALAMSCDQVARAGLFLAASGGDPRTGRVVVSEQSAHRLNALMLTCGQYDGSGDFAYRTGLPAKSGIGGGILAVAPGHAAIAVWSPGLDPSGNSLLGTRALELLSHQTGWSIFDGRRRRPGAAPTWLPHRGVEYSFH